MQDITNTEVSYKRNELKSYLGPFQHKNCHYCKNVYCIQTSEMYEYNTVFALLLMIVKILYRVSLKCIFAIL